MSCWFSEFELDSRPISSGYSSVLLYHLTAKEGFEGFEGFVVPSLMPP
jgi:hypothetical protein